MAEYKQEDCPFVYRIEAVTKIVDGDTVDCVFDLGFDVMFKSRVRLLGIDTANPTMQILEVPEDFVINNDMLSAFRVVRMERSNNTGLMSNNT